MKFKVAVKYILIYLVLNVAGIYMASIFWWTDEVKLSYLGKETVALLFAAGISWLGILFLSIFTARLIRLRPDHYGFINLFDLQDLEFFTKVHLEETIRKKLLFTVSFIAFPLMIISITAFVLSMKGIKSYHLNKYGKVEKVAILSTEHSIKGILYNHIEYANGYYTNLPQKNYPLKDSVNIIYSAKNPKMVSFLEEFREQD